MANWRGRWFWTLPITLLGVLSLPLIPVGLILVAPFLGLNRAFYAVAPLWIRTIFWLGKVDYRISGWDALPEDIRTEQQPVIFMSNHESNLDPAVLTDAIPFPAVYLLKRELKWINPIGWAATMAGFIYVDRSDRERAMRSIHEAAQEVRGGKNLVMFPEGTRTRTGEMLPFKKGGFALALEADVPIVPLATVGGFNMLPAGSLLMKARTYVVVFGQPVNPREFPNREALMAEVRTRIVALRLLAMHPKP